MWIMFWQRLAFSKRLQIRSQNFQHRIFWNITFFSNSVTRGFIRNNTEVCFKNRLFKILMAKIVQPFFNDLEITQKISKHTYLKSCRILPAFYQWTDPRPHVCSVDIYANSYIKLFLSNSLAILLNLQRNVLPITGFNVLLLRFDHCLQCQWRGSFWTVLLSDWTIIC